MIPFVSASLGLGIALAWNPLRFGEVKKLKDEKIDIVNAIEWTKTLEEFCTKNKQEIEKQIVERSKNDEEIVTRNTCMYLCEVGYDSYNPERTDYKSKINSTIPVDPSYKMMKLFFYETQHKPRFLFWEGDQRPAIKCVAAIGNGKLYLCFCGSKDMHDWGLNLTPFGDTLTLYSKSIWMHQGFSTRFEFIRPAIMNFLNIASKFDGLDIVLCGHSLGGAVANICYLYCKDMASCHQEFEKLKFQCITFGEPSLFIEKDIPLLKQFANEKEVDLYQHSLDFVPWISEKPRRTSIVVSLIVPPIIIWLSMLLPPFCSYLLLVNEKYPFLGYLKDFVAATSKMNFLPASRGGSWLELWMLSSLSSFAVMKSFILSKMKTKYFPFGTSIYESQRSLFDYCLVNVHCISRFKELFHKPKQSLNANVDIIAENWGERETITRKYNELERSQFLTHMIQVLSLVLLTSGVIFGVDMVKQRTIGSGSILVWFIKKLIGM